MFTADSAALGVTLRAVIDGTETLTGCEIERAYVDKGYRGHNTTNPRRVFISGQKRGVLAPSSASCDVDQPSKPSSVT